GAVMGPGVFWVGVRLLPLVIRLLVLDGRGWRIARMAGLGDPEVGGEAVLDALPVVPAVGAAEDPGGVLLVEASWLGGVLHELVHAAVDLGVLGILVRNRRLHAAVLDRP